MSIDHKQLLPSVEKTLHTPDLEHSAANINHIRDTTTTHICLCLFFFFQAEDGIRDHCVTGVQTCALPISLAAPDFPSSHGPSWRMVVDWGAGTFQAIYPGGQSENPASAWYDDRVDKWFNEIGRASCRERV